jgi:predicted CopG family antitoxin
MIRTIKIDADAFERLDDARRGTENLSEVIKRCVPKRRTYKEIARIISKLPISEESPEATEESATRRRRETGRRKA